MQVICDIEADGLEDTVSKIWCVVCKDIDSGQVSCFTDYDSDYPSLHTLRTEYAPHVTRWIGHNFIDYDSWVLQHFGNVSIPADSIYDTLVVSRLAGYARPGGHSLEAWGHFLGSPKGTFNDWSKYSKEMMAYCQQDVEVNHKIYQYLLEKVSREEFKEAIAIEHYIAALCSQMRRDGFKFNARRAERILSTTTGALDEIDRALLHLPPKARFVRTYNPKLTKHGTISRTSVPRGWKDLTSLSPDSPFSVIEWDPFNPGSPRQVVERLNDAGWKPVDKTKGHIEALKERKKDKARLDHYRQYGWKVNETNLSTLPDSADPGIKGLVKRLLLEGRRRTLQEWLDNYNVQTGRVHPSFMHIGTWTGRMSHQNPNLGNVAAPKSIKYRTPELSKLAIVYGGAMRSLWGVPTDSYLVGTDAEGIQLRIFAHYINDPKFVEALVNGKSKDGTDPHSLNAKILGCTRDTAKTFIYAFLLGAGDQKIAEILGVSKADGAAAKQRFIAAYPGLKRLKEDTIPGDAERGYFEGFDGRLVLCDNEHLMLAGYLQNGEACIMKHANRLWRERATEERIPFKQVNFVHDEWQTEVAGSLAVAERLAAIQRDSIKEVAQRFKLHCPFAGSSKIGKNWYETH